MNYKWTVLFLVHASSKQTREHVRALTEILKSTRYNEEIKVLMLYGALQHSASEGVKIQVTLHEIVKKEAGAQLAWSEISPGYGAIDIGDDRELNKIFSEIRHNYLSDRFLLFTWDHGSGFGIFKTNPKERELGARDFFLNFEMDIMKEGNTRAATLSKESIDFDIITNYIEERNTTSRDPDEIRGIEKKKIDTSMLTNDELRNVLIYDAGSKKVDLLIMMNCAMQMIETGYALKDAVEYLVAPETCIFWAGYDYPSIINMLCSHPEIETEALAKYAIDTIEAYYEKTPSKDYFKDLVVSLVKPANSLVIKQTIDEIAGHLVAKLADAFDDIRNRRQRCEDLTQKYVGGTPYHYVDFMNCIATLKQPTDDIDIKKLKAALKEYVVHIIKGDNYGSINEENDIGQVNGFTIYYPPFSKSADHDFYYEWFYKAGKQQTLFASQCKWKDFLQKYYRYDRREQKKNIL